MLHRMMLSIAMVANVQSVDWNNKPVYVKNVGEMAAKAAIEI